MFPAPSVKFIVTYALESVFLSFHISVTVFLACGSLKTKSLFRHGFYVMYMVQSIIDCGSIFLASLTFVLDKRVTSGSAAVFLFEHKRLLHFLVGFFVYTQLFFHVSIAANRYMAFSHVFKHEKLWSGKRMFLLVATVIFFAAILASVRFTGETVMIEYDEAFSVINALCAVSAVMTSATTVTCAALELRSFVLYRRLNVALRTAHKDDFGLLAYALLQLVLQCLLTAFYLTMIVAGQRYTELRELALRAFTIVDIVFSICGSTCLFMTRQARVQWS